MNEPDKKKRPQEKEKEKKKKKNGSDEIIGIIHVEVFCSFSFQKPYFVRYLDLLCVDVMGIGIRYRPLGMQNEF